MIASMVLVGGMMAIMGLFGLALATHRTNVDTVRVAGIRADLLPEAQREALVVNPDTGSVTYRNLARRPVLEHPGFFYELQVESSQEESGTELAVLIISWYAGGRLRQDRSQHVLRAEKRFSDLIHTRFREETQP
jgi:hypothetical protein